MNQFIWPPQIEVTRFMQKAGQDCLMLPCIPTKKVQELRLKLHEEEAVIELKKAFEDKDIVEVADAIIDSLVVVIGTAIACGININPLWEAIHKSNMAKFGPGGYKREDGKWMKPPDWVKPDLKAILEKQEPLYTGL